MAEKGKSVSVTREKAAGKTPVEAGERGGLMPDSRDVTVCKPEALTELSEG